MFSRFAWIIKDPDRWNANFHVDDLMAGPTILMKCCGMYHIDFTRYLPASLAFLSFGINFGIFLILALIHLHLAILFIIDIMQDDVTIDRISNGITMIIINSFAIFTLSYYQIKRHKYLQIADFINTRFLSRSAHGLTFNTGEHSYILANRYTFVWTIMCVAGTIQWAIWPLLSPTRALPVNVNYPMLDQMADPYYQIIYILHAVSQFSTGIVFGNASNVLATIVINTCGQFDLLLCSLKNVRATAMTMNGHQTKALLQLKHRFKFDEEELDQYYVNEEMLDDVEKNSADARQRLNDTNIQGFATFGPRKPQDNYLLDFEYELREALLNCIHHHQALVAISEMMEDFLNFFILLKSFQTTFQVCNICFTSLKIEYTSVFQYINLISYIVLSFLDIFQMCYFGEALKRQSMRIGPALFRSPWHLCGGRFRRDMLIVLANTTKPLVMTGGKFFDLDFSKLTGILKASFSYFTLLQKMGD